MTVYVNLDNARHDDQREQMGKIVADKVCPFCPENILKYHTPPIVREGKHWIITPNQWPYEHTEHHLLAITKKHVERLAELDEGSFDELQGHLQWAEKHYRISTGGIAMRFGDITKNGASVRHLHLHLMSPSDKKPVDHYIRFKIS